MNKHEESLKILFSQDSSDICANSIDETIPKDFSDIEDWLNADFCEADGIEEERIQELYDYARLQEKALNKAIETIYEKHSYSCGAYMCTVATTCYEPDEQKRICCKCLKDRYMERK